MSSRQDAHQAWELVAGDDRFNTQMLYFTSSSLSRDDRRIYLISDRDGSPNVYVRHLDSGEETKLTQNSGGMLASYVYFAGTPYRGLGKASVCLDAQRDIIYYIQGRDICRASPEGEPRVLATLPEGQVTAFTHVSGDGTLLCVPTTDARALDFDPQAEGLGPDRRPPYDIDGRVRAEGLRSYLRVYDTRTGEMVRCEAAPGCWITHVQFHPTRNELILYNHEWPQGDCGIRRMWLFDGKTHRRVRTASQDRGRNDWVCHEMWTEDGRGIVYHGAFENGPAFVGQADLYTGTLTEIALPEAYTAYGHFTVNGQGVLACDGYYTPSGTPPGPPENPLDGDAGSPRAAAHICAVHPDWAGKTLRWQPLCRHDSDWLGQDTHPHPIFDHAGNYVYFTSRRGPSVKVYRVRFQGDFI